MTLSTPLLAAAPLVAGLLGPALLGAAPEQHASAALTPRTAAATHLPQAPAVGEVVEHVAAREPADHLRVLSYWTPDRMAKALPIDLPGLVSKQGGLLGGLTGGTGLGLSPAVTGGKVAVVPPRRGARAGARHQSARPLATTSGSRWAVGGAVARTTGRVFLTMNGVDFVCSASTVRGRSRDLVITAGHCVKDGAGAWAKNWTFVPAYGNGGDKPYGQWTARRMFVAGPWSQSSDDSYDVGMVALAPSRGRHVADVVGAQDIAFNSPRGGHAVGFGYPADPPYNGKHLVYCAGRLRDDPYGDTHDQGLGCDMTAGSSGGPWLSRFDTATGRGTITSLSSFKYSDDQRTMYGPILGEAVRKLYLTAERA
ncbi:trypsin-like serine peptidase [Nonomuraea sp. NPDC048826]|uniref:trypsin-like serine peptidase n=1 Tax=Nonomuraea sp. NPDC048826 TaxID=3364347 RepID=UPI003723E7D0